MFTLFYIAVCLRWKKAGATPNFANQKKTNDVKKDEEAAFLVEGVDVYREGVLELDDVDAGQYNL